MRRSNVQVTPSAPRWSSAALIALFAAAACAPAVPPEAPSPLDDLPSTEPVVRVALVVDASESRIEHRGGVVIRDVETGERLAEAPTSGRIDVTAEADQVRLSIAGRSVGPARAFRIEPERDGSLIVDERPYRGTVTIRAEAGNNIAVINHVDMEAYLLGVVPRELGPVGEDLIEASKAQAVAARTYAVSRLGRREARGFDVYATVADQVYGGVRDEHEPITRAVLETAGEILTHNQVPIEAYYHSTCAGQTAAIDEVWNEEPRAYLQSVVDINPETGEAWDHFSSRFRWTQRWTADQIHEILSETLADSLNLGPDGIGELLDMEILERTQSNRIRRMRIVTEAGSVEVGGDRVRWILRTPEGPILNSSLFEVSLIRDRDGDLRELVADGQGWGHGIGMCQVGAMGRARDGGQDYRTILETYYPNTTLRRLY